MRTLFTKLRDRRGVTLIEALTTTTIVGISIAALITAYRVQGSANRLMASSDSERDLETVIRTRVSDDILTPYLMSQCPISLPNFWTALTAGVGKITWGPGINVTLITSAAQITAIPETDANLIDFEALRTRCGAGPDSTPTSTYHRFCLLFQPSAGAVPAPGTLLSHAPVVGEFRYELWDPAAGNATVDCDTAGADGAGLETRPMVGALHYTLYWVTRTAAGQTVQRNSRFMMYAEGAHLP